MEYDINFFRKEYERQKKLEKFINSRKLTRPGTKKWHVAIAFGLFVLFVFVAVAIAVFGRRSIIIPIILFFILIEVYLRFCLILVIKCYQHYASDEVRRRCLCVPSCSEYAILSLKIFPLTVALLKIRKRLYTTCKGEDYKLDFPSKSMNAKFEKMYL